MHTKTIIIQFIVSCLFISFNVNAQISHTDLNRLIEVAKVGKGLDLNDAEWLLNKGFTRTKKERNYFDDGIWEFYELNKNGIKIEYEIRDSGRIDVKINFTESHDNIYKSIKNKMINYKNKGLFENCNWYDKLSHEYQIKNNYVVFIRGIVWNIETNFKYGTIFICNYSHKDKCD
tara:strand:+ start:246 stop:770 length:525 start_codon:yes stop_codon:yes gene_type:complete